MNILDIVKRSSLLKNFMSYSLWGGISKILMFALTFICSNKLTQEGFGEFSFIRNTLNTVITICATSFSSIAIKFASESLLIENSLKKLYILVIFTIITSMLFSTVLLVTPSEILGSYIGNNESVVFYLKLISIILPIAILQPIMSAILQGYKQFTISGLYEMLMSLVCIIFVVVGIKLNSHKGATLALIFYYFVFSVAGIIILYRYNRRHHYIHSVKNIKSELACINYIILPVFIMSFIELPIMWISQAHMANKGGYDLVASLSVILTVRTLVQFIPSYFYQALTPYITQDNTRKDFKSYFDKFDKVSLLLGIMICIMLPLLLIFGKNILSLFSTAYMGSYKAYTLSVIILPLLLYSAHYKLSMMIREHQRSMLVMSIVSSILFLIIFIILAKYINILSSYFYAQGIQYFTQYTYSKVVYIRDKRKCLV